ncbi:hypothetical protein CNY89_27310, partial [Amaricoccus sp. HAR-UPW-R2A-40]
QSHLALQRGELQRLAEAQHDRDEEQPPDRRDRRQLRSSGAATCPTACQTISPPIMPSRLRACRNSPTSPCSAVSCSVWPRPSTTETKSSHQTDGIG